MTWKIIGIAVAAMGGLVGAAIGRDRRRSDRVKADAMRIIAAARAFHADRGRYPDRLDELVPSHLPALPPAKYGEPMGFTYDGSNGRHILGWTDRAPFGRPFYVFEEDRWGYLD